MQLLNIGTGRPEDLEDQHVAPALASGSHMPMDGGRALVSPTGDLELIPQEQLGRAVETGYKVPTQPQLNEFANLSKYGGSGANAAKAMAAGVARGLTFSGSDLALTKTGLVQPETLEGLKTYQHGPSTFGEVLGAGAGLLVAPEGELVEGASAALKAAKASGNAAEIAKAAHSLEVAKSAFTAGDALNPVSAVSKAGRQITHAIAPEGAGALTQIGAHALGMGAEGAVYGAAPSISEAALGDPDRAAEMLVGNVGLGALLGGGIGGLFRAGQLAVPASVGKAKDVLGRGWRTLWGDAVPKEPGGTSYSPWEARFPSGAEPSAAPEAGEPFLGTATAAEPDVGLAATGTEGRPDLSPPGPPPPVPPPATEPKVGAIPKAMAKVNEALTGTPAAQTIEAFQHRASGAGEILSQEERAAFHGQLDEALQETHDAMEKASIDAGANVRPKESMALLEDGDAVKATAELQRVKGVMQNVIAEMRSSPELYPARFPAKLDLVLEGLENGEAPGASAADIYSELTRARKAIDDRIPWGKEITGEAADAVALAKHLRTQLKASLEDESVWGKAAARTGAFNESINDRLSALKEFRKQFMYKTANRSGGVSWKINPRKTSEFLNQINDPRGKMRGEALREFFRTSAKHIDEMEKTYKAAPFESFDKEALESLVKKNAAQADRAQSIVAAQPGMGFGGLGNLARLGVAGHFGGPIGAILAAGKSALSPDAAAAGLANIERAGMTTGKVIGKAMKGIFKPAAEQARKGLGVLSEKLTPGEKLEKIKAKVDETQDHISSAENLADTLDRATREGAQAAPKTMAAVQATALRGLQFLQSKMPTTEPTSPFETAPEPNAGQLMAFERYHRIVNDPLSILDEMRSGTLTPESVEAIQAVYPRLHQEIAQAAVEHAAEAKGGTPYRTRLILSQFMGQPLDRSLTPGAMQTFQAATVQAAQEQGGAPHPTSAGMQHLNIAQRSATDFQKTSLKEG